MTAVSCIHLVYIGKKAPEDRDMGIQSSACSGEWGRRGGEEALASSVYVVLYTC